MMLLTSSFQGWEYVVNELRTCKTYPDYRFFLFLFTILNIVFFFFKFLCLHIYRISFTIHNEILEPIGPHDFELYETNDRILEISGTKILGNLW